MTQGPLPNLEYQTPVRQGVNGLAVAGFVVSLLSFLTCSLIGPVGLCLSIAGVRRQPRGLAVAGIVLGSLSTLILLAAVGLFIVGMMGVRTVSRMAVPAATGTSLSLGNADIVLFSARRGWVLPDDADGSGAVTRLDEWGRPMRYHRISAVRFAIRSAGPDGVFDTADDVVQEFGYVPLVPPPATAPTLEI